MQAQTPIETTLPPLPQSNKPLLWIEDDELFVKTNIETFSKISNIEVVTRTKAEDAMVEIDHHLLNYGGVCVDLNLKSNLDGTDVYRRIREQNAAIPITIVSGQENDYGDEIEELEEEFDEEVVIARKPFPVYTEKTMPTSLKGIVTSYELYNKIYLNPLSISLDEFFALKEDQRDLLFEQVAGLTKEKRTEVFKSCQYEWIVLANINGKLELVDFSSDLNRLDDDHLMGLTKEFGVPVFPYFAPVYIEELDEGWNDISENDAYPTISIGFSENTVSNFYFDTGCRFNYFSHKYFKRKKIIKRFSYFLAGQDEKAWGTVIFLVKDTFDCSLKTESGTEICAKIDCKLVKSGWEEAFCQKYTGRVGLVGRSFVIQNSLSVLLDGKNRTTKIIKNED